MVHRARFLFCATCLGTSLVHPEEAVTHNSQGHGVFSKRVLSLLRGPQNGVLFPMCSLQTHPSTGSLITETLLHQRTTLQAGKETLASQ